MHDPKPQPNAFGRAFWGWSALLWLVKGLFIVALADVFFYGEELAKGSVAKAMLDGVAVPFHTMAYHYYEGGGFLISGLKALAFLLVGENMLAHRLLGLGTCWAVFWALWRLVHHHFGRTAAHWAAALFVFGPSGFQRYSLLTLGIHFEAMVFGLLLLDEGLRLLRAKDWSPTRLRCATVGAIAGFGIFFSYQIGLILGWVGLWVLALRWRWLFSAAGLWLLGGFLVGLSPLLYMATHVGSALLDVHGTDLAQVESNWSKLQTFLHTLFVAAPRGELATHVLFGAAGILALWLGWRASQTRRWIWFYWSGFVGLWLLAWYTGPFLEPRPVTFFAWLRWAPMTLVLMILGAWGLSAAAPRRESREEAPGGSSPVILWLGRAVVLLGIVQSALILGNGRLTQAPQNFALLKSTKGYNYLGHFGTFMAHQESLDPDSLRPLLGYQESDLDLLYGDFAITAITLARQNGTVRTPEEWVVYFETVDAEHSERFDRGMGPAFVQAVGGSLPAALQSLQAFESQGALTEDRIARWRFAIGYYGTGWSYRPQDILSDVEGTPEAFWDESFLRGVGARLYRFSVVYPYGGSLVMHPKRAAAFLNSFPPIARAALRTGLEQEALLWTLPGSDGPDW